MPVAQGAHAVPFTHPNATWTVTSSFPIGQSVHSFIHSVEWLISLWSSLSIHTPCDAPRSREHRVQCRPGTEAPCRGDGPPQQARLRRRHLPRWPLGPPPRSPAESGWSGQGVVLNDRGDDAAAANTTSSPSPGPGWPLDHLFVRQPSQDLQGVVLGVRVVRMGRHTAARFDVPRWLLCSTPLLRVEPGSGQCRRPDPPPPQRARPAGAPPWEWTSNLSRLPFCLSS
jgi:hypothetical protein